MLGMHSALLVLDMCGNNKGSSGIIARIGALRKNKDLCKFTVDLSDMSKEREVCEYDYRISFANHDFALSVYTKIMIYICHCFTHRAGLGQAPKCNFCH